MENTKYADAGFIKAAYFRQETMRNTQGMRIEMFEVIKMAKKGTDTQFSGSRKVNYADQKVKEAYRKINKMLGGN